MNEVNPVSQSLSSSKPLSPPIHTVDSTAAEINQIAVQALKDQSRSEHTKGVALAITACILYAGAVGFFAIGAAPISAALVATACLVIILSARQFSISQKLLDQSYALKTSFEKQVKFEKFSQLEAELSQFLPKETDTKEQVVEKAERTYAFNKRMMDEGISGDWAQSNASLYYPIPELKDGTNIKKNVDLVQKCVEWSLGYVRWHKNAAKPTKEI